MNGCSNGSEWIAWCSAAGPPSIVRSSEGEAPAKAVKKVSSSRNNAACVSATGEICRGDFVERDEQLAEAGLRRGEVVQHRHRVFASGRSVWIVLLMPTPRPAKPSPKALVFCWIAIRVCLSKMLKKSWISTGSRACETGIVAPAGIVRGECPRFSSRYFRPIVDTDSTSIVVSAGSGPACFSSFRLTIAVTLPVVGFWWGTIRSRSRCAGRTAAPGCPFQGPRLPVVRP